MKADEKVVAEIIRIEHSEEDNRLFLVFEVKDELYKQQILKNWVQDIEYKLVDQKLVLND